MMIGAELFRQGPRPKAMAVASVVNWIGTFIIALCFESVAVSSSSSGRRLVLFHSGLLYARSAYRQTMSRSLLRLCGVVVQDLTGDYVFTIFIVLLIAFLIFTYVFVPETKNKTFEEIANQFSPGEPLEVEEMVEDDDEYDELDEAEVEAEPGLTDDEHGDHALVTLNFDSSSAPAAKPSQ